MTTLVGRQIAVNMDPDGTRYAPTNGRSDVSRTDNGGFVVVWSTGSIRANAFDSSGQTLTHEQVLLQGYLRFTNEGFTGLSRLFYDPTIVQLANGQLVVACREVISTKVGDVDDRTFTDGLFFSVGANSFTNLRSISLAGPEGPSSGDPSAIGYVQPMIYAGSNGGFGVRFYTYSEPGSGLLSDLITVNSNTAGTSKTVTHNDPDALVSIASFQGGAALYAAQIDGDTTFQFFAGGLPTGASLTISYGELPAAEIGTEYNTPLPTYLFAQNDTACVIAWREQSLSGDGIVHIRVYNSNGSQRGSEILTDKPLSDVALLDDGRVVAVWSEGSPLTISSIFSLLPGAGLDVYAQVYELNGYASGPAVRVNTVTTYDQWKPNVEALDGGRFVVTWYDANRSTIEYGAFTDINAQVLKAAPPGVQRVGNNSANTLLGGFGFDQLYGGGGNDGLSGGALNDTLDGGLGDDTMIGGMGDDTFVVDSISDIVTENAGGGSDWIQTDLSTFRLALNPNIENVQYTGAGGFLGLGNALNNQIFGGAGDDTLNGGGGADTLRGGGGNDVLDGGGGAGDIVSYRDAGVRVDVSLTTGVGQGSVGVGADALSNFEGVEGSAYNDVLIGNAGANALSGLAGADTLLGGQGNDTLIGGVGADLLTGGGARDAFVFNTLIGAGQVDRISDFRVIDDTIWLENAIFEALGAAGPLSATKFHIGAFAHDADDRILYNPVNGALIYDANGNLTSGPVVIAYLPTQLSLTAADFVVI